MDRDKMYDLARKVHRMDMMLDKLRRMVEVNEVAISSTEVVAIGTSDDASDLFMDVRERMTCFVQARLIRLKGELMLELNPSVTLGTIGAKMEV